MTPTYVLTERLRDMECLCRILARRISTEQTGIIDSDMSVEQLLDLLRFSADQLLPEYGDYVDSLATTNPEVES